MRRQEEVSRIRERKEESHFHSTKEDKVYTAIESCTILAFDQEINISVSRNNDFAPYC